jgi:hypothetical protein
MAAKWQRRSRVEVELGSSFSACMARLRSHFGIKHLLLKSSWANESLEGSPPADSDGPRTRIKSLVQSDLNALAPRQSA